MLSRIGLSFSLNFVIGPNINMTVLSVTRTWYKFIYEHDLMVN